ncbi:hypothetical protein GGX14DRAFT_543405 [Mycena pura]|uniref:Uncharacterized protein n=1 Tax=Mycena pura TaxID=153505 RepID=A0AAD6VD30_9AGAR|nr:hypothetical protein GGX14DRAFT_543405 [Mycena pura]
MTYSRYPRALPPPPMSSVSRRPSAARALSLHPSALSDAEHAFFTASLADLTDSAIDWDTTTVTAREARAWLCGRYVSLGPGTVDEILRLFAPAPTLSAGTFCAALRLVLHACGGRPIERSLAFVQAPVPVSASVSDAFVLLPRANAGTNPFLPTPEPSPEARPHPRLPARAPTRTSNDAASSSSSSFASVSVSSRASSSLESASGLSPGPAPGRKAHTYSASMSALATSDFGSSPLSSPPVHPLRRASTQHAHAPSPASQLQRTPSNPNPFRPPPLPPRRASASAATHPPPAARAHAPSPFSDTAPAGLPRTAPPTRATFALSPDYRAQADAHPASAAASTTAFALHPHDRPHSRRIVSDTASPPPRARERERTASASTPPPLPLALPLPRALRRTLAGAGWIGAERGETEGLVRVRGGGGGGGGEGGRGWKNTRHGPTVKAGPGKFPGLTCTIYQVLHWRKPVDLL